MRFATLLLADSEYPARLRELRKPPPTVYVSGELPEGPAVGIVGTREPTPEAATFARDLASDLAGRGVVIFSGGAAGIDTAAHVGATATGKTVVVAPSSLDRPFPVENEDLFRNVVEGRGAFLTTYPPGTAAARHHFFARNQVLAALVDVLVVVETHYRGGARNAAKAARDLGRVLLVVPGAPWNYKAAGCLLEIRNGARMATGPGDVLRALSIVPSGEKSPIRPAVQLSFQRILEARDPDLETILRALENGSIDPDELCSRTGLPAATVQASLLTLTLEGIVVSGPSGRFSLVSV